MARAEFGISNKDLDDIIEAIQKVSSEELIGILNDDILKLKKEAANFLQIIIDVQEKIRILETNMWNQKKLRDSIRAELGITGKFVKKYETKEYSQNKDIIKKQLEDQAINDLYQAAFNFHKVLISSLGQEIQTIIILEDEEGNPFAFNVSEEEIFNNNFLSYESASKTERLTARFKNTTTQMKNAGIDAINRDDLNINDDLNIDKLNETYKIVIYRFDTYKQIVMWFYPDQWNRSKVSARGDIAEAYASFFLQQTKWNFNSSNKEKNIDYFMRDGVAEVDNISGLLQGDISSGRYEYAIKSADASYMSIKQMIPLAKEIIFKDNYSIVNLQKYKDKLAQKKQKIRNPIETICAEKVDESLRQMVSQIDGAMLTN